ncbi:MAG: histidine kinase [Chitinophagaceae bacterium]|nr:histidine kinase [Chitinophagaceae bacterium]
MLHGQERIAHYHEQNGLLSDFTYSGMFDRNNYLWVCSSRGLSRFNGTDFSHFTVREGLPDNDIVEVQEDESGVIWATPFLREPAFLEPGKTLFVNINTIIHPDTVRGDGPYRVFLLKNNTVALICGTVIRLVRNKRWIKSMRIPHRSFSPAHSLLFENDKGDLILFGSGKILLLHPLGSIDSSPQPFPYFWRIWEDPLLWLHCRDNAIVCIDTRKGTMGTMIHHIQFSDSIYRFGTWNDSLLLSTKSGKLIMADRRGRGFSFPKRTMLLSTTAESKDNRVKVMFTRDEGIYVQVKADESLYKELPAAPASLLRRGEKIEVLDAQNRWLSPVRLRGVQLPGYSNRIVAEFSEVRDDLTWIYGNHAEARQGSTLIQRVDTVLNIKDVSVASDSIRYLAAQAGAFMLNIRQRTQRRLYDKRANSVSEGMDHSVFIGTYRGLLQRLADGCLVDWRDAGFPDIRVTDLAFKNDVIWVATGGRGLWAIRHNILYNILDESKGLVSDAIEAIAVDGADHVVLGYAKGVQRLAYDLHARDIKITELLTLHTVKGEGIKYLHYAGGKVYGLGSRGLLTIPEQLQEPVKDFLIQIDRVLIDGVPTELKSSYRLRPGTHDLSVSFSAVNYEQFPVRYRYRNNEEAWTYTSDPEISYHSLGAGDYRIEIQVLNNYAEPSSVQVLQLSVQRPLLLRSGFILSATGVLLVLLVASVRVWYQYKYNKAKKALQQETRLRELELAALKAQINPHFVFNCLNSIKALVYQHLLEEADLYMDHFARLFRSTLEASITPYHSLEKETDFIYAYLSLEQINVNNRFGFEISLQEPLQAGTVMIPPMLLQPYVENAVKHGVARLKDRKGHILIRFEQHGDQLICIIADNGIGLGHDHDKKNGAGMKISRKRALLYHIQTEVTDNIPYGTLVRLILTLKSSKPDD